MIFTRSGKILKVFGTKRFPKITKLLKKCVDKEMVSPVLDSGIVLDVSLAKTHNDIF